MDDKKYLRKLQMMVGRAVNEGCEAVVVSGDDKGNMNADVFKTTPNLDELKENDNSITWFDLILIDPNTKSIVERDRYDKDEDGNWTW